MIDSTSASKERTGFLDITIIGADNTYSTGAMSFSFLDTSGNAIGSAVSADLRRRSRLTMEAKRRAAHSGPWFPSR